MSTLALGQFVPAYAPGDNKVVLNWQRYIAEEDAWVRASLHSGDRLDLNLFPSISTYAHHSGKRVTAGVYFEIAAKYAEKVDGEIIQCATVVGCRGTSASGELLLARYPSMPMNFTRICQGFQDLWLN